MMYGVLGKGIWTLLPRSQCDITKWVASLLAFISTSIGLGRPTHHHRGNVPISSVDSQGSHTFLQRMKECVFFCTVPGGQLGKWCVSFTSPVRCKNVTAVLLQAKRYGLRNLLAKKVAALPALTVPCRALVRAFTSIHGSVLSCGAPIRALRAKEVA